MPPLLGDPRRAGGGEAWPVSGLCPGLAAWSSPGPPLSFSLASFVLSNHFCMRLPYSFLFFCLTLPLWIFSLTAVKVREWEGRPGSWEGLVCVANPRSNTSLFWSLSPPGPPRRCPGSGPGCHGSSQVQRKPGCHSLEVAVPLSSLAPFPSPSPSPPSVRLVFIQTLHSHLQLPQHSELPPFPFCPDGPSFSPLQASPLTFPFCLRLTPPLYSL